MNTTNDIMQSQEAAEAGVMAEASALAEAGNDSQLAEELAKLRAARAAAMDAIGDNLMGLLQEAVQFRSEFEREWVEDIRQFEHGNPGGPAAIPLTKADAAEEEWRQSNDNITRPATTTFAARLADMIYPTSDRNWDIDCTPKPELPPEIVESIAAGPDGQGISDDMLDTLIGEVAKKRAAKMRREIDDQLAECRYNDHGREVIFDACKLGHGVMKGPFAKASRRRRYMAGQGFKAVVEEVMTDPKVCRVDPWLVYPLPCRRIDDAPGVFELHELSPKKLSDLRIQPGFSTQQVERLLRMAPNWNAVASSQLSMRSIDDRSTLARNDSNYAIFEYNGEMPKEALSVFLDQLIDESKIDEEQAQLLLSVVDESNALHLHCCVWMCQGVVLKVAVSPIDYDHCVYKFFVFEERENAPFGKGVPRLLRDPQLSVRMLWSAIMLNAIMSSAPQIGVKKGALVPMGPGGGAIDLRCTRPRVWAFNDEVEDVGKAMQAFVVPNTIAGVLPVYERAKQNGQEQVMLPLIAQGEPTQAVPTSSGLAMLMNASNIVQRRLAARYDAHITTPIIQGFYDWNMEYGEESAKGDYKIIARASSHLLVKDVQAQHFLTALQLYSSNPLLQPRMKMAAWAEEALRIMDIDVDRFLKTDEELQAEQGEQSEQQGPDADTLKAEAASKAADARMMEAETRAAKVQGDQELQHIDRQLDYEDRIADRESRERIAAMRVQQAMAGLDAVAQARVMELQAGMQRDADRNATQTRIAGIRAAEKAQELAQRERKIATEIAVESPNPRLA